MGAVRRGGAHQPLSEINVTPFVDVMLVLLIIFMVTAPMMQQGVDVDLPETTTQPIRVQDEPLILTVQKDGKVYVGAPRDPARPSCATSWWRSSRAGTAGSCSCARTRRPPTGVVVKALAAAREAGATKLGMVTEPEK